MEMMKTRPRREDVRKQQHLHTRPRLEVGLRAAGSMDDSRPARTLYSRLRREIQVLTEQGYLIKRHEDGRDPRDTRLRTAASVAARQE